MEANREHLARIIAGVPVWNAWRAENPFIVAPDLEDADLRGRDLRDVNFASTNLCSVRLDGCNLAGARFFSARLSGTKMAGSNLRGAKFGQASFSGTDFSSADLSDAELAGCLLNGVDLNEASLEGADLTRSVFLRASLRGTRFARAALSTGFADVDLSRAIGLDEVRHVGPSSIGIDTLYRSAGAIPHAFLREAGIPDTFIAYVDSLVAGPIEFQSCFISYSTVDEPFADRLYRDLRREGVRCWFAPESLKVGDRFRREIDQSILVHDRLLVIMSAASLASAWVEEEVEAALERERRTTGTVLFPIRIDEAVMQTDTAWAASLRRTRHIGDFSGCQDARLYSAAKTRLIRDLRLLTPASR